MRSSVVMPYAPAMIKLLQGPLCSDDGPSWTLLLKYADQVRAYCAQIGLELQLHEEDGFSYLRQPALEDDDGRPLELPRLIRRVPLNYQVTLLCVLLREQLLQFEAGNLENSACILARQQIRDLLMPFLPERANELQMQDKVDAVISRVVDLGFLKKMTSLGADYFEVRRILKAKINAEKLVEVKERLRSYGTTEQ